MYIQIMYIYIRIYTYIYIYTHVHICVHVQYVQYMFDIYIYDMVCNDQRDMMSILWLDPSCK